VRPTSLAWGFTLLFAACTPAQIRLPEPSPEVAPPPVLAHVPPGCEANLSGTYAHRDDNTYRYTISDDGQHLRLRAFRQYGGTRVELATTSEVELQRTATGIHGESIVAAHTRLGQPCPVRFPYELTACSAEGLTLRTAQQLGLNDQCAVTDGVHLDLIETGLLRLPAADAGADHADAG
jgi:hypothetical protein